jgi:Zn finger protein HypA/HybF involved in hydrogenase expression
MRSKEEFYHLCLKRKEENMKKLNSGIKNCLCCGSETKYEKTYSKCPKCKSLSWLVGYNYPCEICGRIFLSLAVHHIDGNHNNNVIENLIFICPFCHSNIHHERKEGSNFKIRYYRNILLGKINFNLEDVIVL